MSQDKYSLIKKYVSFYNHVLELPDTILGPIEDMIGNIPLKQADVGYISSLIREEFLKILGDRYSHKASTLNEVILSEFKGWFLHVDSHCAQLGKGHTFSYRIGKLSPLYSMTKYTSSPHHWGIPSESYKYILYPTEEIIMMGYILGVNFYLSKEDKYEVWGN